MPNPSEPYQKESRFFFSVRMDQTSDKKKGITFCKVVKEGTIIKVDILNYIKSLNITWLRKVEIEDPKWKPILYACFPDIRHLASFRN